MATFMSLLSDPRTQANNPLDALVQAFMAQSELGKSYQQQVQQQKIADVITGRNVPEYLQSEMTPQQIQEQQLNAIMAINPQLAPQIADFVKAQKFGALAGAQADVINQYLYGQQGGGTPIGGQAPMQIGGATPNTLAPDPALEAIVKQLNDAAMLKGVSGGLIDNTAGAQLKADIYKKGAEKTAEAQAELDSPVRKDAKQKAEQSLQELSDLYDQLHEKGGIVSAGKGELQNLGSAAANSAVGQYINKKRGTPEQSIRNQINKKVPLVINDIRQATGMSAKAMDSNTELQFYLSAISDLGSDYESNKDAIATLSKKYGLGKVRPIGGAKSAPIQKDLKSMSLEELQALRKQLGGK